MNPLRSRGERRARRSTRAAASVTTIVLAMAVASCAATSEAPRGDVADTFDVGDGRRMYLECRGSGTPTVLLVSGQRGSAEDWSITTEGPASDAVFPRLADHTRVCAYDRPGTPVGMEFSRSDPAPQPTTVADMVADLHALLDAAGEPGPYVMVGHSAGGLAARLFAATSPRDVVALVLVDALSPGLQDAETAEEWEIQRVLLAGDIEESLAEYPDLEQVDAEASIAQVRAAPPLQPMPLVVISADHAYGPLFPELIASGQVPSGVPEDFGYVLDEAQRESQAGLAGLLPGAVHLTKTDSGHAVHQEQPRLVAEAILDVVIRVRD
ncbi:alpha/beta fold hydrolase [Agromyces bauzanensis]